MTSRTTIEAKTKTIEDILKKLHKEAKINQTQCGEQIRMQIHTTIAAIVVETSPSSATDQSGFNGFGGYRW